MEFLKKWDDKQEDVANTLYEIYLNIKSLCVIACKLFEGTGTGTTYIVRRLVSVVCMCMCDCVYMYM